MKRRATEDPIGHVRAEINRAARHGTTVDVLDLGFGSGQHWRCAPTPSSARLTAVDASGEWLGKDEDVRPQEVIIGIVPEALAEIPSRSYDIVLAIDLIEHLPKHEGYLLLYEMQRIARRLATIYTPNGLVWQPPSADNPWNAHISGWTPKELRDFGWTEIQGCRGLRSLRGPYSRSAADPSSTLGRYAFGALSRATTPLGRIPRWSYAFTASVRPGVTGHAPEPTDLWD